jgi:hypothetical protein
MGNPELTNGKPAPVVADAPEGIKQAAIAIWDDAIKLYYGKGGIRELTDKIAEKLNVTGTKMLELWQTCLQFNATTALATFESATKFAESHAVTTAWELAKRADADAERPKLRDLLPTWGNAKSNIIAAAREKLDISNRETFPTVSSVATALKAVRDGRAPQTPTGQQSKVKFSDKLQATVNALLISLAALNADQQDSISGEVMILTHKADSMRSAPAVVTETVALTAEARKQAAMRGGSRAAA